MLERICCQNGHKTEQNSVNRCSGRPHDSQTVLASIRGLGIFAQDFVNGM